MLLVRFRQVGSHNLLSRDRYSMYACMYMYMVAGGGGEGVDFLPTPTADHGAFLENHFHDREYLKMGVWVQSLPQELRSGRRSQLP